MKPMTSNNGVCLYVQGVAASCNEADLDAIFQSYGKVSSIKLPLEPVTKNHRGYAFVTMCNHDGAQACIEALNGIDLGGRRLVVEVSKRSTGHARRPGVYAGHDQEARGTSRGRGRGTSRGRSPVDVSGPTGHRNLMQGSSRYAESNRYRGMIGPSSCQWADVAVAEPLSEPAAAASLPATAAEPRRATLVAEPEPATEPGGEPVSWSSQQRGQEVPCAELPASSRHSPRHRGEPLVEPATEPGGEPLIEEDPACSAERRPKGSDQRVESPHSRISQLEQANIRLMAKQTADNMLLNFQQCGYGDPRGAAQDCLKVACELAGTQPPRITVATDLASATQNPVLVSPTEFKNPSCFLRVYGDPLAATAPRHGSYQPESHQDGNWRCEQCGNVNFPRRQRCNKCSAPRGLNGDAIVLKYCMQVYDLLLRGKGCE